MFDLNRSSERAPDGATIDQEQAAHNRKNKALANLETAKERWGYAVPVEEESDPEFMLDLASAVESAGGDAAIQKALVELANAVKRGGPEKIDVSGKWRDIARMMNDRFGMKAA